MDNYTSLQKVLHRIALSPQFIREISFDFEKMFFSKRDSTVIGNHVFISGMARSGTTTLLNAIYASDRFASLTYDDMPFVLAPNCWQLVSSQKPRTKTQERAHGDGITFSTNSPEAFEEVFWNTFEQYSEKKEEKFRAYISLVLIKYNKTRYLSKNNQNIKRLENITAYFPESSVFILFRNPLQQVNSLLSQHQKFVKLQKANPFVLSYMNWIGHSEFGLSYQPLVTKDLQFTNSNCLNHWMEQWYLTYKSILEYSETKSNIQLVCYESLCNDEAVWKSIQTYLGITSKNAFAFTESRKEILAPFNFALNERCEELYIQIKDKSFGA